MFEVGEVSKSKSKLGIIFRTHFGSSWVEAVEAFTDVTTLVEAFSLEM